ncbi:MAG: hypothetical protein K1X67_10320 [Fimbriimonadaceae bacterium]|nr:hypothetical protein [Fimbriimonadaceae bacterium]
MKVHDLVRLNRDAGFATAIDLMDFRKPESNAELCGSFCFARLEKKPVFGSWDWLRMVGIGLATGQKNIWSLTANYGHGKTHFGVVLANFFGQPWGDSNLSKIQELLASVSSQEHAEQILAWRQAHPKPYLTLCLQGHQMPNLKQAVLQEVERELLRHEASKDYAPPLWQAKALEWIDRLDATTESAAKEWLNKKGRDLADIRKSLVERDSRTDFRRLVDELSAAVVADGIPKQFGFEITVRSLLDTLHDDLCGEGKPFTGIAIIFDEFHVFIDSVARRPEPGDTLQDLFEAILAPERRKHGTAVLVALGTMDPNEAARRSIGELLPDNPVAKQLNRIPREHRYELRSELEAVLDGLLEQQPSQWEVFQPSVTESIRDATIVTFEAFKDRLSVELGYSLDQVKNKITIGSFPLHPISTMLLSNLRFDVVQNPRGVLEFVKDQFFRMTDQDALVDGHPNWIVANELYEPFFPMFKSELRSKVEAARDSLGGDCSAEHDWVLRAMTLIAAGNLPTLNAGRGGYARLVSEIAGISLQTAQETLDDLLERGIIELERVSGAYRFFSGANRAQFEQALRAARGNVRLDLKSIDELTTLVASSAPDFMRAKPAAVDWGSSTDWGFVRLVAMRSQLEAGLLSKLPRFSDQLSFAGTKDWVRAVELVFLPLSPDDVEWIKREGPSLIQQAYPSLEAPPVVIVTATEVASAVEAALVDLAATDLVSQDDRIKLRDQWTTGLDQVKQRLRAAVDKYGREKVTRIVAPPLRSTLDALGDKSDQAVGAGLLRKAYSKGPAKFSSASHLGQHSFTNGCAKLAGALLTGSVNAIRTAEPNGPAMTVAENYLRNEWGILDADYQLRSPNDSRILALWAELHEEFPAGSSRPLAPILQRFARPPYGLDTCTVALVTCGWLGSQGREVQLNLDGPTTMSRLCPDQKMTTLLGNLLRLKIKREDIGELNERAKVLIEQIESQSEVFTRAEATEVIRVLENFLKAPLEGWESRCESAVQVLQADLEAARAYYALVNGVAESFNNPGRLLDCLEKLGKATPGRVNEGWPAPIELRTNVSESLTSVWETNGAASAEIKDLTQYELQRERLRILESKATKIGATGFAEQVRETLVKLDERRKLLASLAEQKELVGELRGFQPKRQTLLELRQAREAFLKQAESIAPLAPEVEEKLAAKLADIDAEISGLADPAGSIQVTLSQVGNWRALHALNTSLERLADRLHGTPEANGVVQLRDRAERFLQLIDDLQAIDKNPPEARSKLLKKAEEVQRYVDDKSAPPAIQQVAERVLASLRSTEAARIRAADKDFERNERSIAARTTKIRDLERLQEYFASPPEYVSGDRRLRAASHVVEIETLLVTRSADYIRSIANRIKDDKKTLLELAKFLKDLAEES